MQNRLAVREAVLVIGEADNSCGSAAGVSLRGLAALLLALLLPLTITACGPLNPFGDAPEAPANQRFGYVREAMEIIWQAAPDADSYTIYFGDADCRLDSGRPVNCEELVSDIEYTHYLHHNYRNETGNFWVVACNRFGCSAIDTANPAQLLPPPPAEIGLLQEGSSLRITWSPVPGATRYKVYHNQDSARCTPSHSYHPQCAELAGDVVGTAYTHAIPAPKGPYRVDVIDRTSDSLTISWSGVDNTHHYWVAACTDLGCSAINTDYTPAEFVASYEVLPLYYLIYRQPEGQEALEISHTPTGSSASHFQYVDKSLQPNTVYYYRVNACNDSGCYDGSSRAGGLTEARGPVDPPTTPSGFRAEKVNVREAPDNARVFWNVVEGATYYELWQGLESSGLFKLDLTLSAPLLPCSLEQSDVNSFCYYDGSPNRGDFGIEFATTSYKARACNKAGCSPFTESLTLR